MFAERSRRELEKLNIELNDNFNRLLEKGRSVIWVDDIIKGTILDEYITNEEVRNSIFINYDDESPKIGEK